MSTSKEYMQLVLDQLEEFPDVTYRKMFGEYMVYLQGRPVTETAEADRHARGPQYSEVWFWSRTKVSQCM